MLSNHYTKDILMKSGPIFVNNMEGRKLMLLWLPLKAGTDPSKPLSILLKQEHVLLILVESILKKLIFI